MGFRRRITGVIRSLMRVISPSRGLNPYRRYVLKGNPGNVVARWREARDAQEPRLNLRVLDQFFEAVGIETRSSKASRHTAGSSSFFGSGHMCR